MSPKTPSGKGPLIPVGIFTVGESGVNIVEVEELRSSPALPGVALKSSETDRNGERMDSSVRGTLEVEVVGEEEEDG